MYSKIVDPGSGNPVDVNSRFGKNILKQYVKTAIRLMSGGRVSMPSEYYGKDSGRYSEGNQDGGRVSMPSEYYGKDSGRYSESNQEGGRVSMPSEYYGDDSGRYSEQTGGQWGMEDPDASLPDFTQAGGWGAKIEEDP